MAVKLHELIRLAYAKGYRVTEDGKLIGTSGKVRPIRKGSKERYPRFSIKCGTGYSDSGIYGIPVHMFAAYCFYGEEVFKEGLVVRHLNGNTLDVSKDNILLGTQSDNNLDKPKEVRIAAANKASQRLIELYGGSSPARKLSDEQVRSIRNMLSEGTLSCAEIARRHNISKDSVYRIRDGKSFKHVV